LRDGYNAQGGDKPFEPLTTAWTRSAFRSLRNPKGGEGVSKKRGDGDRKDNVLQGRVSAYRD